MVDSTTFIYICIFIHLFVYYSYVSNEIHIEPSKGEGTNRARSVKMRARKKNTEKTAAGEKGGERSEKLACHPLERA